MQPEVLKSQQQAEIEESRRRSILLTVMARAMTNAVKSKRQQKEIIQNIEALTEDPKQIMVAEDLEQSQKPVIVYAPKQASFVNEMMQEQTPSSKFELNLFS